MLSEQPVVLNVTYIIKNGMRQKFIDELYKNEISIKSKSENGNLKYQYYLPIDNENELFLVEVWQDKNALDSHKNMEHFKKLQDIKTEYVDSVLIEEFVGK